MTPAEQRTAAIAKAQQTVRLHGEIRSLLRRGEITLAQAIHRPGARRMRVTDLLMTSRWVGPARSKATMLTLGIPADGAHLCRVEELTLVQRLSLLAAWEVAIA